MNKSPVRHVMGLSGGKDSAALAIYMRDKVPEMEYFFADTGAELPETIEFIEFMQDYLGKKIKKLTPHNGFDFFLKKYEFLPSPQQRWCTVNLKLIPFEQFIKSDETISYIAIRSDEPSRVGYISKKPNIKTLFPFVEDKIGKEEVIRILEESGVGLPKYYEWRSRSGCYFCFFQRKEEWLGLYKNHPALFQKAREYEKINLDAGERFTWSQTESLEELLERADVIKARKKQVNTKTLFEIMMSEDEEDLENRACPICRL